MNTLTRYQYFYSDQVQALGGLQAAKQHMKGLFLLHARYKRISPQAAKFIIDQIQVLQDAIARTEENATCELVLLV